MTTKAVLLLPNTRDLPSFSASMQRKQPLTLGSFASPTYSILQGAQILSISVLQKQVIFPIVREHFDPDIEHKHVKTARTGRLLPRVHIRFFGELIPFSQVAVHTGRDDVRPLGHAAPR